MKGQILTTIMILSLVACNNNDDPMPDISFEGTLKSSGSVNFSGVCTWSVEYVNSIFEIKYDDGTQTPLTARVSTEMIETINSGGCSKPYPRNTHVYTLRSFSVSQTKMLLYFKQDNMSFPQNEASFSGTINNSVIEGTLTFFRKSDAIFCKVDMPINLQKEQ